MHQPSPSPGRPRSAWLMRSGSQPSSLETLSPSILLSAQKPEAPIVWDTAGFVSDSTSAVTSAARAIDRASLRTLRAKRLHDEEKELEAREQAQAFPNADSPPADTSGMFGFAQPTAVSRAALQRLRAARMHSEERALDGVGEIETEDQENAAVETSVQSACVDLLKDDCVPSSVLQPQTNMIVIGRPSRAKLQKLRAARLHAEEQELEAIATAPRQETQSFLFCGPSMQQMRASRVHSEEQGLYSGDRRRLQQLRAQRLHAEERRLDATASGRLVAH